MRKWGTTLHGARGWNEEQGDERGTSQHLLRSGELMGLHAQQNILKWKTQLTLLHIHRASRVPLPTLHTRDPHGCTQAHFSTSQQTSVIGKVGSSANRGSQSHECNSAKPPGRLARKKGKSRTEPKERDNQWGRAQGSLPPSQKGDCRSTVLPPHPARSSWWVGQNLAFAALDTQSHSCAQKSLVQLLMSRAWLKVSTPSLPSLLQPWQWPGCYADTS